MILGAPIIRAVYRPENIYSKDEFPDTATKLRR
jgi:hypothetical protein